MAAFQILDPEKKGYIDADRMKEYLSSGAVGFREKEWNEFLEYSRDKPGEHPERIYYEDYVAKLTNFVDKHIEGLYEEVKR